MNSKYHCTYAVPSWNIEKRCGKRAYFTAIDNAGTFGHLCDEHAKQLTPEIRDYHYIDERKRKGKPTND